ncbi:histidinol-phosphate transaminase [Sporosarcina aquimarina]|uniref:Histidinol-phosphate aminotransferase n=1 Tax=Sporosarcina aquimarina TaxID=114975 RepID=A0ABU4FYB5_9BACL|nr:histidinol-phosphate transaminase [Sporosarcina aquimarina]MDW0109075.1 histidinol-phosphate transaminase [Sporosarcina aquimarina]
MNWKPVLATMKPYKPGRSIEDVQKEYNLGEIVKLASNENPYGCAPSVRRLLESPQLEYEMYPDTSSPSLKTMLAKSLGVQEKCVILGNGSDDLITIISRSLLNGDTNTIMPSPSFPQYAHNARIEGAEVREIPLVEGQHDLERFLKEIDSATAVIWLCNPNNPTGDLIPSYKIKKFLETVPKHILTVLDEAYFEYITDDSYENPVNWLSEYPNLIILRTFSKAYGLASFRIGYGIASSEVISELNKVRNPFNTGSLSLLVAETALEDQSFIEKCRAENHKQRLRFYEFAKEHSLKVNVSEANFVLLEVPMDADEATDELMQKGFIVRSGNLLGTPNRIRVTIGTEEQNNGFFTALESIITNRG